ncbi:MAG: IS110 family transposase [Acidimicrobiales bacterium]
MKQQAARVGGLDVHRDNVVAATRINEPGGEVSVTKKRFPTTRRGIGELISFLADASVTRVALEATGVYWKPVYYGLEGLFDELWLCNAHHVKNVPGRKTDLSDAEWLADVAAHGMVRPSFVPPPEIRELRELTRYRKTQADDRAREIQRLEKTLQDAGIKLTSVASAVWSMSSRKIIEALIAGERNPRVLAGLVVGKLRPKIALLEEALDGHFGAHHAIVCRQVIEHIDFLDRSIAALSEEIAARLLPFEAAVTLVRSITGIGELSAQTIVAEIGLDMSRFPTAGHLCAWAGVAPASHESAGTRRPAGTRHGCTWLRRVLIEVARAASRTKGSYFSAQYSRIARKRGTNKAAVAVANSILAVVWYVLTNGCVYEDPGADYFERRNDPVREAKRLLARIEALGYHVTITPKAA